jgi:hypothetical protein
VGCKKYSINKLYIRSFYLSLQKNILMETTDWKAKSIQRSKDNKQLKKKIKELTISRDDWKIKSISNKSRADKFEADIKKVKEKLNVIISQ